MNARRASALLILIMTSTAFLPAATKPDAAGGAASLTITVDPRIELLATVQLLSDYKGYQGMPVLTKLDFPYRRAVETYFAPFKSHTAVSLFSRMSRQGFWYGHPPGVMVHLGPPPELREISPCDPFPVERAGGRQSLDQFLDALRAFARETRFMDFFLSQRETYDRLTSRYRALIPRDYVNDIEQYFGTRQNSYHVVLAPLFHCGGFGPRVESRRGVYDVFNMSGPCKVEDGLPDFGTEVDVRRIFWHEFSHSFVNWLTDGEVDKFIPFAPALLGSSVPPGEVKVAVAEFVSEHIIRAVTIRLAFLHMGEPEGEEALKTEQSSSYPHVQPVCEALKQYEAHRDRYRTFADFYPQLVPVFEALARAKAAAAPAK